MDGADALLLLTATREPDGLTDYRVFRLVLDRAGYRFAPLLEQRLAVHYCNADVALSAASGLSPVVFGPRALEKRVKCRSFYFDLGLLEDYWLRRKYHHTMSSTLVYALYEALSIVEEEGLDTRWARHCVQNGERQSWRGHYLLPRQPAFIVRLVGGVVRAPGICTETRCRESGRRDRIGRGIGDATVPLLYERDAGGVDIEDTSGQHDREDHVLDAGCGACRRLRQRPALSRRHHAHALDRHRQDVGRDLGEHRMVALALRGGAGRDHHLAAGLDRDLRALVGTQPGVLDVARDTEAEIFSGGARRLKAGALRPSFEVAPCPSTACSMPFASSPSPRW